VSLAEYRDGLRLSVSTLTVLPLPPQGELTRTVAGTAMVAAPAVGLLLGLAMEGLVLALAQAAAPPLLAGVAVVAALGLFTRGLHLDGLADTVDALGSYADRERALAIMRSPEIGPFATVALVLTLIAQVVAVAELAARSSSDPQPLGAVALAVCASRLAIPWCTRRGVPAARTDGLGAMVAGTVPLAACLATTAAVQTAAVLVGGLGAVLAVALGLACVGLLLHHLCRRLGGLTGDGIGAAVELSLTATLVALAV